MVGPSSHYTLQGGARAAPRASLSTPRRHEDRARASTRAYPRPRLPQPETTARAHTYTHRHNCSLSLSLSLPPSLPPSLSLSLSLSVTPTHTPTHTRTPTHMPAHRTHACACCDMPPAGIWRWRVCWCIAIRRDSSAHHPPRESGRRPRESGRRPRVGGARAASQTSAHARPARESGIARRLPTGRTRTQGGRTPWNWCRGWPCWPLS